MLKFKNILYPINLDSKKIHNIELAIEMSLDNKATLHFLYVNDEAAGYRHPTLFEDSGALRIKSDVDPGLLEKASVVYASAKGELADEVREYCRKNAIDLVITSHKHHGKLYSSLFDTRDENILDSVKIPVLLLPRKD
jgi:nucleotide-binding universal stress UspA family protein